MLQRSDKGREEFPSPTPPELLEWVEPFDLPGSYKEQLALMADPAWLASQNYQAQLRRADRTGGSFVILEFERLLVKRMAAYKVPMFTAELNRSAGRQAVLRAQGFSKLLDGPHMHGMAVDIVHAVKGWSLSRQQWGMIGEIGEELAKQRSLKVVWGGRWKDPWDPAHWEVKDWRSFVKS